MTKTKKDVYESALASGETEKSARAKAEGYPEYEVTQMDKEPVKLGIKTKMEKTDSYWKEYFITLRWVIGAILVAFVAWLIFSNCCSVPLS